VRQILLNATLDKLLLARIKSLKPTDPVFGVLPTYEQIGLEWHNIMADCKIQKFNEFGQKRVIHAFRHVFISEAMTKVLPVMVQFCIGHS